ncbi:MAG: DUF1572 family protein [Flavobacteriales bacterium]|nr:DUF1572 family protein [Flavobacteriales bacterium]
MSVSEQLKQESLRRLEESRQRIHRCLDLLGEERAWHRPNANTPTVGNLVLHLAGNVGQWITTTLGNRPDTRDRDTEFAETEPLPIADLKRTFDSVLDAAMGTISSLTDPDLAATWRVQGFQETGTAILVHVVEHMSYHTGQITLHTKLALDIDTGWYADQDLSAKG